MIRALILIHLWSLVVASSAWILQRDGNQRVGVRFPAPTTWLALIALCLLPGALCVMPLGAIISLPEAKVFDLIPTQVSASPVEASGLLGFLTMYASVSVLLIIRTLWQWSCLQRLPLVATAQPGVFTTTSSVPPLTLSWPRKAVVIAEAFQDHATLIRHERTHLQHHDAEVTLLLLLLRDLMLLSPGVSYLVRQWRLAIELRADSAATQMLTTAQRKSYAELLLSIQRPGSAGQRSFPCPTAQLRSTQHRAVKMRLYKIIEQAPAARLRHWGAAISLTTIVASAIGLMSSVASATDQLVDAGSGPVAYIKQTSLPLPASCAGLKRSDVKTVSKAPTLDGSSSVQHSMRLGLVILLHDIRADGSVHNPRIIDSTHQCFEANAKAAIVQWMVEPQATPVKDAAVKIPFVISGPTVEDLNRQLDDFLR